MISQVEIELKARIDKVSAEPEIEESGCCVSLRRRLFSVFTRCLHFNTNTNTITNTKYKIRLLCLTALQCTGETSLQRIYQVPSVQWKRILQSYIVSSRSYIAHASCNQCHSYFLLGIIHFNDGMCEQKCYHVRYRPEH